MVRNAIVPRTPIGYSVLDGAWCAPCLNKESVPMSQGSTRRRPAPRAPADGSMAGKTFSELRVPQGCFPAAVLRGTQVLSPSPDLRIQVGDELLVVAGPGAECRIGELG